MLPLIAASAAGGELALLGTAVVAGHGQVRQALEDAGVTDPNSLAKGTYIYGTAVGALQLVVPWATLRGLTKPATEAFAGTIAQISARMASGTMKMSLAQSLAMGAGPLAGGVLASVTDLRMPFAVSGVVLVLAALLILAVPAPPAMTESEAA